MISWKEEYSVGVLEIDEQHKKLFDIANRAYDLLKNDFSVDKYDRIVDIFEELNNYTKFHFDYEENYMLRIGYKRLLSHKVQHDDFIEKINSIDLDKVDEDQDKYLIDILEFIVKWITGHILGRDKDYSMEK